MIIEQDREQVREAVSLHTRAEIRSIRLAESHVYSRSGIDSISAKGLDFEVSFEPVSSSTEPGSLKVETGFRFSVVPEGEPQNPILRIQCQFEVRYALLDDFSPSETQIEAFRAANAVFNLWPYFREYVQSTTVRMGFPPPPVEFLRLVQKPSTPGNDLKAESAPPRRRSGAQSAKR